MTFIPPWENIVETKNCTISGEKFFVTDKDLEFYDKISPMFDGKKYSIPSPTLCPHERTRRRMMFRNFQSLYNRKSDLSQKQILSMYHSESTFPVYTIEEWWSDDWDAMSYGKKYNPDVSIQEQVGELQRTVPRINIMNTNCENCAFSNFSFRAKNGYLVFGNVDSEDCMYGHIIWKSKNCIDGVYNYECEYLYDCVDCAKSYHLKHCQQCNHCTESEHLIHCNQCDYCFGCVGLQSKKFHIFNTPYSETEYNQKIQELKGRSDAHEIIQRKLQELQQNSITKYMVGYGNESYVGDYLYHSSNVYDCFDIKRSENLKYCTTIAEFKDSYDCNYHATNSDHMYECLTSTGSNIAFCHNVMNESSSVYYSEFCYGSHDIFGCVGLKSKKNCILNLAYSKLEYEQLAWKIISQMQEERIWGEFFDHTKSPFGYNETIADTYFPLTKTQAQKRGYAWRDEDERSSYHGAYYTPLPIRQYQENIVGKEIAQKNIHDCLQWILICEISKKPFKIIAKELAYLIEQGIEIPRDCWEVRYKKLMHKRNKRELHTRACGKCNREMTTTLDRKVSNNVYCEECYQEALY